MRRNAILKNLTTLLFAVALSCVGLPQAYAQTAAVMQNAATANGNGTVLTVNGLATAALTVNCSGCGGGTQVNFEGTSDGSNWTSILATLYGTTTTATSTTTSGVGVWSLPVPGMISVRARISAYSAGSVTVTGRSTNAPSGGSSAVTVSGTVNVDVVGNTIGLATFAQIGATTGAYSCATDTTAVTTNQSLKCIAQLLQTAVGPATAANSNPFVQSYNTLVSGAVTSAMTGTTSTSVVSGTASNYLYITNCVVSNASLTVSTDIILQDGSGGTTLYNIPAPAAAVATTGGGGASVSFPIPLKVPTSGNALYAANVTTGSSTKISCSGFRSTISY